MTTTVLPAWAAQLRSQYLAGESSMFLLHGNVRDLQPWQHEDGSVEWIDLRAFLENFLERTRQVIAYYNVSQGLQFTNKEHEATFRKVVDGRRRLTGKEKLPANLPSQASKVIPIVEDLIVEPNTSSALILDFFETIGTNAEISNQNHEQMANLVSLQRWSTDPAFNNTDNIVILVSEHISDISRRITSSASLVSIQINFPEEATREAYLLDQPLDSVSLAMEVPVLAKMTAGLTLLQIRAILRGAATTREMIDFAQISSRKKRIIEQECQGLVEFIPPRHNFSHVGGLEPIKATLTKVAQAIRSGQKSRVPMGIILVGVQGGGKTFLAEAFATESGLTCLKLKNFRDKWVGSTEANLEKVLNLVEALGYVLLIIDEADRGLSGGESDGGVGSRVIARLKEFMSDTSHRGRVVVMMMTNRPDKLDADLKRPGRFDLKIPFFFPETVEERAAIFQAVSRKNKLNVALDVDFTGPAHAVEGYSGAEIEAVMLAAASLSGEADEDLISQEHIDQAVQDVIPSRDTPMLEYMEMLAVFECSNKSMLPAGYRELTPDQIQLQLETMRVGLGRRAL